MPPFNTLTPSSLPGLVRHLLVAGSLAAAACASPSESDGSGGNNGGGNTPPPPVRVVRVDVDPATPTLETGAVLRAAATPRAADGTAVAGRTVRWTSSDAAVAAVDGTGEIRAVAAGTAEITATVDDASGRVRVTVTAPSQAPVRVASVTIAGMRPLWAGEQLQLMAVARDANGTVLADRVATWGTADAGVAPVDAQGLVLAAGAGRSLVTATIEGVRAEAAVDVAARPAHQLLFQASRSRRVTLWRTSPGSEAYPTPIFEDGRVATHPAVSPDGAWIAFAGPSGDGDVEIFVARTDGSGLRRLTTSAGTDDQPAWSPDGRRIAFRSARGGELDVWVMNADGSDPRNVTNSAYQIGTPAAAEPVWSPDGSRIVFVRLEPSSTGYRGMLASVRPDGSDLRLLTNVPGYHDEAPAFSPDGSMIAFVRRAEGAATGEIMLITPQGAQVVLIHYPGAGRAPAWSPDGRWLAFTDAAGRVLLTRLNDEYRRPMTRLDGSGDGEEVTWLPQ